METDKDQENHQAFLLDKVNAALRELGSTAQWKRAPEFLKEYEPLRGKTVLLVDDVNDVLQAIMPELIVATDGNASFIEYKQQELEELVKEIIERNPNIVLLDYHLSDELKGETIVRTLAEQQFVGSAIGFSSDSDTTRSFKNSGAMASVRKNAGFPEATVKDIAKLFDQEGA